MRYTHYLLVLSSLLFVDITISRDQKTKIVTQQEPARNAQNKLDQFLGRVTPLETVARELGISSTEAFDMLANQEKVVVDFCASWCGPCNNIAPKLEKLAQKYSRILFVKIDTEKHANIARDFKVRSIPLFIFVRCNKIEGKIAGADESALRRKLDEFAQA